MATDARQPPTITIYSCSIGERFVLATDSHRPTDFPRSRLCDETTFVGSGGGSGVVVLRPELLIVAWASPIVFNPKALRAYRTEEKITPVLCDF
jgi:hypothetical protein